MAVKTILWISNFALADGVLALFYHSSLGDELSRSADVEEHVVSPGFVFIILFFFTCLLFIFLESLNYLPGFSNAILEDCKSANIL